MKKVSKHRSMLIKKSKLLPGYILIIIWCCFTFMLLGWVLFASLSTTSEIFSGKVGLFASGVHFENFIKAWKTQKVSIIFKNSLIYTISSCVFLIIICAPASYALSKFKFHGNRLIQSSFSTAMGVPVTMIVMPLFCVCARMGLVDNALKNRMVMIVLLTGINLPYTVIYLLSFFSRIPHDFSEAATIDGCGQIRLFWSIMFPMAQPGIVTVTIFNFTKIWGEYFLSLLFANSDKMRPVAVGLFSMINSMKYTGDWSGLFASIVIITLPTILIYVFLSEKIIAGITAGGLKG